MAEEAKGPTTAEKRAAKLKETEDQVRLHLSPPETNPLFNLVLYKTMNAQGVRIVDIDKLVVAELKRQIPT